MRRSTPKGDLWVANYSGQTIAEFTPSQLAASGSPVPAVVITDSAEPTALAFDANGDLWATNASRWHPGVHARSADISGSPTPAVTITGAEADSWGLTFDASRRPLGRDLQRQQLVVEYRPDQLPPPSGPPRPSRSQDSTTRDSRRLTPRVICGSPHTLAAQWLKFTPGQLTSSGSPTPAVSLTGPAFDQPGRPGVRHRR